jgi:uncharacterized integral membrane protein (TIGR00698 family)
MTASDSETPTMLRVSSVSGLWPGLLLACVPALLAWLGGMALPLVGGAVLAIVLGVVLRSAWTPPARYQPGIEFTGKYVLQAAIVLLGFGLNLHDVARVGQASLHVTLATLALAGIATWLLHRWLRIPGKLAVLVGVGTAICGASAIAAVAPILRADEHDTAFALSTIFLFNLLAVLFFPPLGHMLGMDASQFGLWAGTAINDTSSVVAAGYAYGHAAGDYAVIVKLARASMIVPICLLLAGALALRARTHATAGPASPLRGGFFPWFIVWFIAASMLRSAGWVPIRALPSLHLASDLAMVLALAAIGLSANLAQMRATGPRPILLGLGVWLAVALGSLAVQAL